MIAFKGIGMISVGYVYMFRLPFSCREKCVSVFPVVEKICPPRLLPRFAVCAGDASAVTAARSMAVLPCGERRGRSARPALERILASPNSPEILRRSAKRAVESIDGKAPMQ
jgi:hypothetical protein